MGDLQGAARDMALVLDLRPSAQSYFHQAQITMKQGQKEAARQFLLLAKENGIALTSLHPIERKAYTALEEELR